MCVGISLQQIDKQIEEVKKQIQVLDIELGLLLKLKKKVKPTSLQEGQFDYSGLGAKEAVLKLVEHFSPVKTKNIVDELENQINSLAKNKRRCIQSTINNLIKAKTLTKDNEGVIHIRRQ